ncbi:hypothetical protein XENTR_v10001356 [Xenopus tropicalis]|nr:hypothetical protein XENTR_v10001356 [Xenopus tropicalis]KAE8631915.1 hypothetical protein XENTR_v10001356 [Xenopus tropicalis]
MYYHMTLSYMGQLLDEISILWVIAVGYSIWFPRPCFPDFIKNRSHFGTVIFTLAAISTMLSFVKPVVNAYALNCITFHILYIVVKEIRKCSNHRILHLAFVSVCLWIVAISCWLSDRLFCSFWRRINFCYLHSIWHVFICITVVYSNTLFAYFDAMYEIPESQPQVQYWPLKSLQVGLPYLSITKHRKNC